MRRMTLGLSYRSEKQNRTNNSIKRNSLPGHNSAPRYSPVTWRSCCIKGNGTMRHSDPAYEYERNLTRRQLFGRTSLGLGTAALAHLLSPELQADQHGPKSAGLHHPAKAKRVIYLFMSGGPSHHDLWDYKPKMKDMFGEPLPEHIRDGQRITGMTANQKTLPVCPSKYKFTQYNNHDRGIWVSELLPETATVVKDLCVIHSTFTEAIN